MAFRTRRQARYERLRERGFLPFEARALSKVSRRTPYLSHLVGDRFKQLKRAQEQKWSNARYEREIKKRYKQKEWSYLKRYDPWAMVRESEDRYRKRHPDYESPWERKRRRWRGFLGKFEKTHELYPRKMTQRQLKEQESYLQKQQEEIDRQFEWIRRQREGRAG